MPSHSEPRFTTPIERPSPFLCMWVAPLPKSEATDSVRSCRANQHGSPYASRPKLTVAFESCSIQKPGQVVVGSGSSGENRDWKSSAWSQECRDGRYDGRP